MAQEINSLKLAGKVAIVTGAGNGLGAECAKVLAAQGAKVAVTDINLAAAQGVAAAIEQQGGHAIALKTDVAVEGDVQAMAAAVAERWGRIDILLNNAAALDTKTRHADRDVSWIQPVDATH